MDNQLKQQSVSEPKLCAACQTFYANPQYVSLCSQCFKNSVKEKAVEVLVVEDVVATTSALAPQSRLAAAQTDHESCWQCGKRAGLSAFTCKCCFSFCKKHRLPETHSCSFDFKADGRAQISKLNPRVEPSKLERI